jgi:hypothetical protein
MTFFYFMMLSNSSSPYDIHSLHGAKVLTPNLFMPKTDTPNISPTTFPNLIVSNLATLLTKSACTQLMSSRKFVIKFGGMKWLLLVLIRSRYLPIPS